MTEAIREQQKKDYLDQVELEKNRLKEMIAKKGLKESNPASEFTLERAATYQVSSRWQQARLREKAATDSLTGLFNHGFTEASVAREIERAKRGKPFGILMADVDNFREFNNTYGHLAGDEALKKVAQAFRVNSRAADIQGRWGGEEFVVVLPEANEQKTQEIAERIRRNIEETPFDAVVQGKDIKLKLTASIGATVYRKGDDKTSIIDRADDLMYGAKRETGKNQIKFG